MVHLVGILCKTLLLCAFVFCWLLLAGVERLEYCSSISARFAGLKVEQDSGINGISQFVILRDKSPGDKGSIISYSEITDCFSSSHSIGG